MDFDDTPHSEPRANSSNDLAVALAKERPVRRFAGLERILRSFSVGERLVLYVLTIVLALSAFSLVYQLDAAVSVTVPARGGSLVEGEIGPARFINPILTLSQADEDLTALVYSGLMRALPDGTYAPDLAQSYDISPDGTTYTFHLRPGATFQDGTPVTAADVLFTVQKAQDPGINSPRRADWEGVQVSSPDPETVVFKLPHPYAPFIENTTMGILPKHIWENISDEEFPFATANTRPIGSGPYEIANVATDSTGSATLYDLVPFDKFALGAPYLAHISFVFYANEPAMIVALNAHQIDAAADITPSDLASVTRKDLNIVSVPLPRVFGIFFNQSHNAVLADASVRSALDTAVDKQQIVNDALNGYGAVLEGPIPPGVSGQSIAATPSPFSAPAASSSSATTTPNPDDIAAARAILQKGGWTFNTKTNAWTKSKQTLSLSLATADEPELVATADAVAADWRALGAQVTVQVYPLSELNTNVIRPRSYDAVLFGEVVGRSLDLFAFWHSSQRNDPGLNLAMYANSNADSLLAQARASSDEKTRDKLYAQFTALVQKDEPAVFLYAPDFIYLVPNSLQGVQLGALTTPAERFLNVYDWYNETENVWSIFTNQNANTY